MGWLPNALTLSRFPAAVAIVWIYFASPYRFVILLIAGYAFATDFLDGFLARRWKCESTFGTIIDPYADKSICWSIIVVILPALNGWMMLTPIICIAAYDLVGLVTIPILAQKKVKVDPFAKRKTLILMTGLLVLYIGSLLEGAAVDYLRFAGLTLLWLACYLTVRASGGYLRTYLGLRKVPSIPYIL